MTEREETILRGALELAPSARAEIAAELIASLDEEVERDVQQQWALEIERRVAAVRDGALRGEDWRPVLAEIERDVLGQ